MMPPAVEFEEEFREAEELNQQEQDSSSDSDEVIALDSPIDIDFPEETFHSRQLAQQDPYQEQEHERQQQQQEASPVPIVVSDIVTNSAANLHLQTAFPPALRPLAPKPSKVKMKTGHKGSKRPREPTNPGPNPKRRKGNRRDTPCVYCTRRIANDPNWACYDAILGQDGNQTYTGVRCDGCVAGHVSCHLIPEKAMVAVDKLSKAAAEAVAASNGPDKIQLLAAYEAAIGPALRAIASVPRGAEEHKRRKPRQKPEHFQSNHTEPSKDAAATHAPPAWKAASERPNPAFTSASSHQKQHHADPADFFAPPAPPQQNGRSGETDADYERRERQALRRRKVQALESISHTAALFLAEFMTFAKQRQSPTSSSGWGRGGGVGGQQYLGEGSVPAPNQGVDYAAAAAAGMATSMASVFQPLANGDVEDSSDSDSDSSDASTIENPLQDPAPFQSFAADVASAHGEESNDADHGGGGGEGFDADVEVDEDQEPRASTKREEESDGEGRQWSEVKVEDG